MVKRVEITELVGKTFSRVYQADCFDGYDGIVFDQYQLTHRNGCCESVSVEEIIGDLNDLVDTEILEAREDSNCQTASDEYSHETWTFFNFRTIKGSVTVRFYGTSNGYYSESADLYYVG